VENNSELVACAASALERPENAGFAARVRVVEADVTDQHELQQTGMVPDGSADFVLMNPPYDQPDRVRPSPDGGRRRAHIAEPSALGTWASTAAGLLRAGALVGVIHRAAALPVVLEALKAASFGDLRVLPVHPFADKPASRIVVRGRKGSRGDPQLLPGLVLHETGGGWTGKADAILRGRADLGVR
jgi:tRNA1(Val) A37 N6-methylase TrmN6